MLFTLPPTTLYARDNHGKIREWTITNKRDHITISHGLQGGAHQETVENIPVGKANRTVQEQIESRINSRITKQLQKGYKRTIDEAKESRTNALGLYRPMKAQLLKNNLKLDISHGYIQIKYNGHRCLITKQNNKMIAYSSNGKIIESIGHILKSIVIPEGMTIDGELYAHGHTLQEIGSWIKRKQANSYRLEFHAYDLISNEIFSKRLYNLQEVNLGEAAHVVPTWNKQEIISIQKKMDEVREDGYEGLIVRIDTAGYEDGKRSKSVLKIKKWMDDEFLVLNVHLSDKGRPVLTCRTKWNTLFDVTPPGTFEEKQHVYDNITSYIGTTVRCEFESYTKDNIPFQPIAIMWRNKDEE